MGSSIALAETRFMLASPLNKIIFIVRLSRKLTQRKRPSASHETLPTDMRFQLQHTFLIFGIILIIFSFLFFGLSNGLYSTLLLSGLLISFLSFLLILLKDDHGQRWRWVIIIVVAMVIQQLSEPLLIRYSYKILIHQNDQLFTEINQIMQLKKGDIFYLKSSQKDSSKFTVHENSRIRQLMEATNIHLISKDSDKVFYETYGLLDVRLGIFYFPSGNTPARRFKQIEGKWYY